MVFTDSIGLVFLGIAIGIGGALAAGHLIASLLFGVTSTDALTFGMAGILMVLVSALAGYIPARKASRVDPTVALRAE
jgi:ABC-type antimicrobial peptide transport system permease subunit